MRVLVAFSDFGAQGRDNDEVAGLQNLLASRSDIVVEWLHLPSNNLSTDDLLFLRMLPVSKAADALIALDLTATVLRHSRKFALMLRKPSQIEEGPAVWPVLMRGLSESELILLPEADSQLFGFSDRLAERVVVYEAGEFAGKQESDARSGRGFRSLMKVLGS